MVALKNISKSFGPKPVLQDINMSFETGKAYGIVGENGAGKTTLFHCIAGLLSHEGMITAPGGLLKDRLGFLQTDPYFFQKMTGREYLRLLCNARNIQTADLDHQNIFELPLDQYASAYSTGMKKKLAFLGLLIQDNAFFILDEPFNGVDIHSNILIEAIIKQLKSAGKTILISSHIFSTLQDTCDEIYLLKQGRLIKKVARAEFGQLEAEMKDFVLGDRLERIGLG